MRKLSIIACAALFAAPVVMAEETSKIITDIGFSSDRTKEKRNVVLHFAPVTLENGEATVTGKRTAHATS